MYIYIYLYINIYGLSSCSAGTHFGGVNGPNVSCLQIVSGEMSMSNNIRLSTHTCVHAWNASLLEARTSTPRHEASSLQLGLLNTPPVRHNPEPAILTSVFQDSKGKTSAPNNRLINALYGVARPCLQ